MQTTTDGDQYGVTTIDKTGQGVLKSSNHRKIAAKSHWKNKVSQKLQSLVFFEKVDGFVRLNLEFFDVFRSGKFVVECLLKDIVSCAIFFPPSLQFLFRKKTKEVST